MLKNIAYYLILGKPIVLYFGLITIILLVATAIIGAQVLKGKAKISWHKLIAAITIILALVHAVLALSLYLNY